MMKTEAKIEPFSSTCGNIVMNSVKTHSAISQASEERDTVLMDSIKTEPHSDSFLIKDGEIKEEDSKLLSLEKDFLEGNVNEIKIETSHVGYDLTSDIKPDPDLNLMKLEAEGQSWWNADDVKQEMSDMTEDDHENPSDSFAEHDQTVKESDDLKMPKDIPSVTYHTEMAVGIKDKHCGTEDDTSIPKSLKCNSCDKSFGDLNQLEDHIIIHMGVNALKCDMCDKSFRHMRTLQDHVLSHTDDKPFKCNDCNKDFRRKQDLQIHVFTHRDDKPFKCDMCTKSFSRSAILRDHVFTHTGQKPFRCTICDKSFGRRQYLEAHAFCHKSDKPYTCSICDKSFQCRQYLRAHIITHSDERPFKCNYCHKSFRRRYRLEHHSFTHRAENTTQMYVLL
ncbi:zinc finger protein Paris-like [Periplaneta americana]|uniref:zinc finger protein Paris-like n=1 Tax=Periplaneta americana TaxID=6978 RepID=UPI0037E820A3